VHLCLGEVLLYQAHARGENQQVRVPRIMQQGATTGFRRAVNLAGTQACAGFIEKILRLNLC